MNIESRVMPGTSDRVADQKALSQRAAVMCAGACHRENVVSLTHQDYRLTFKVAEERFVVGELVQFNARFQIRS